MVNFNEFRTDLNNAINEVLIKHGMIHVQTDLRKYRGDTGRFRMMAMDFQATSANAQLVHNFQKQISITPSTDPVLKAAMQKFGIASTTNSKGDELIAYVPSRKKYPFVYKSIRGARWKQDVEMARARFGIA